MGASDDHMPGGCFHSRPTLVQRVEARLYLRLAVARVGKRGEARIVGTSGPGIIVREGVAGGGERSDR